MPPSAGCHGRIIRHICDPQTERAEATAQKRLPLFPHQIQLDDSTRMTTRIESSVETHTEKNRG